MKAQEHLPIYGVGPYYGIGVIVTALAGLVLSATGVLSAGALHSRPAALCFAAAGCLLLLLGGCVWAPAALGRHAIDHYIQADRLCTTGVYRFVRNPCYSGIMLFCTGLLLLARNLLLLPLPPLYWLAMTVLMKHTEEKWLAERYGEAYRQYCKRVNRCLPWIPK